MLSTVNIPRVSNVITMAECPNGYHELGRDFGSLTESHGGVCTSDAEIFMQDCLNNDTDTLCVVMIGSKSSMTIPAAPLFQQSGCFDNYHDLGINSTAFQNVLENGACLGGYEVFDLNPKCTVNTDDLICVVVNGAITSMAITLGGRPAYVQNGCPDDYVNMNADTVAIPRINSVCDNGYETFTLNQQCDENTTDGFCVELCKNGTIYSNGTGQCGTYCDLGFTTLNAGNAGHKVLTLPVWKEKQVTPSLNVGIPENRCYVNALPGQKAGTINLKYNGTTYHLTD